MKKINKKILSAFILSAMVLATFGGCKEEESSQSSLTDSEREAIQKPGLKFTYGDAVESTSSGNELDMPDPTAAATTAATTAASGNTVTSVVTVTDSQGAVVTEIEEVTDSVGSVVTTQAVVTDNSGSAVTDSQGQTVTTVVNATQIVQKTEVVTNQESQSDSSTTGSQTETTTSSSYQADMRSFNALWLDVSEEKNYVFNDAFIEVAVTIKEDIPDGKYPINITWPDLACYDEEVIGKSIDVDHIINGYIYVNTPVDETQTFPEDGLGVMAENVEGKQGDEVVLRFKMNNNPGICAVNFNFEYDQNAIEIIEAYAVGDFADITGNASL